MTAADVVELVRLLRVHNVDVVLDGGWGVDALLERQTRPHADLDIAIAEDQVATLRRVLDERGFRVQGESAHQPHNFVLVDAVGRRLDVHVWPGIPYPLASLEGTGVVAGESVRCITAEWTVRFHCQYEPDEDDYHDVRALCEHFGIALPELYERFASRSTSS